MRAAKLIVIATLAVAAGGCVSRKTRETEVGVLVCKFAIGCANKGVQQEMFPPGSTNFVAPWIRDFYTFDIKLQNLEMVLDAKKGDRRESDDLKFKTTDGNDISMDVTVIWQVIPQKAPDLLVNVGSLTNEVKEKLVRPMARTYVRDVLNELDSESVYNADKRFQKAEEAREVLAKALEPYGVLVTQVILHEHRFAPEYERIIHDRKLAEQRAEQLKSETLSAEQEALRNLETARGKVAADIAAVDGVLAQTKLAADAEYYESQQSSEALLAERTANAKAISKRNEALRGAGGRAMVKLRLAEALEGKPIIVVPSGANGLGINKLDLNKLIQSQLANDESP